MDFIIRGRRAGKTHQLVQDLGTDPTATIICPTEQMVARFKEEYPNLQCRIISWQRRATLLGTSGLVGIDNLDIILAYEFGRSTPAVVTATGHTR